MLDRKYNLFYLLINATLHQIIIQSPDQDPLLVNLSLN